MRVINVQGFIEDQQQNRMERRSSQFVKFLNKTPSFPIYYAVNRNLSTSEIGTSSIDAYISPESPIRFNKIKNLPIYGFPVITNESEYDETIGASSEGYSGEAIIVPGVITPTEGDCFVMKILNRTTFFVVNEVREVVLKSKTHYYIGFHIGIADLLPQLEKQVIENYTAIFDNIGTQDKVVISDGDNEKANKFTEIYEDIHNYYLNSFFKTRTTTFETTVKFIHDPDNCSNRYTDKFLVKFMEENRIIVFDTLLRTSLILDFNGLDDSNDFLEYQKSIFYAVVNKQLNRAKECQYISLKELATPFSLFRGTVNDTLYVADKFTVDGDDNEKFEFVINTNLGDIIRRCKSNDIHQDSADDKLISIIVKFFNGIELTANDFKDVFNSGASALTEYELLPIILFILRVQINVLLLDAGNNIL